MLPTYNSVFQSEYPRFCEGGVLTVFRVIFFFIDESTDSPGSGTVSPKVTTLPPLKRMLSDKEGQTGVQSAGSPNKTTQEGGSLFPQPF